MNDRKPFRKFSARGPSGPMETMAVSRAKAVSNLRRRLVTECHMTPYAASSYDLGDCHEVTE